MEKKIDIQKKGGASVLSTRTLWHESDRMTCPFISSHILQRALSLMTSSYQNKFAIAQVVSIDIYHVIFIILNVTSSCLLVLLYTPRSCSVSKVK